MGRILTLLLVSLCVLVLSFVGPSKAIAANVTGEPVRLDLRLISSDLVDEMIYTWVRNSPFQGATPLVVAEVNAPVGVDARFEESLENHLFAVLRANPRLPVQLVHCSMCRQWVTVSTPKKTIIGKALQQPELAEQFKQYPHLHALSLHFDVVVDEIVLWAEIYSVQAPQRVVWSQRFSSSARARSVLQEPSKLVSIAEAREEQKRLIEGRDAFRLVTRLPIRNFSGKTDGGQLQAEVPPIIFLEQSFEAVLAPNQKRRAGLSVGITSLEGTMQGWSVGANYMQLLGRNEPSLVNPDLYLRAGVTYINLQGPGAAMFGENQIDVARLLNADAEPRAALTAWNIGLEAHVKYRFGFAAYVEYMPTLDSSQVIETQRLILPFHSATVAGVFQW